ncbi:MAG: cytochrome c3 family protein [Magnetococcales bacterium]|nr:cytochrome c3 family protein [Magnetococcales bacterium]
MAAEEFPSNFTNTGGISNTRHNLSLSTNVSQAAMITARNQYGEVCVYCHTPHGANANIAAPLWNRTFKSNTYQTYDQLRTSSLTAKVNQPGINSLTCLSCHDGTVAVDSIINMPGSGRYNANGLTSHQEAFLDSWITVPGQTSVSPNHLAMGLSSPAKSNAGCMSCHNSDIGVAHSFAIANIGTDLRDEHPIGVEIPTARIGQDFIGPTVTLDKVAFFDLNANNKPDSNEIRFFKTGDTYRVECASCHDPHGVAATHGGQIHPTFLRVKNDGSAVCLTCHAK